MSRNSTIKFPSNISIDELLYNIQIQCLLIEIVDYLKEENKISIFKEQLRNSRTTNEELFNLDKILNSISFVELDKGSKQLILHQLKAFLNKSEVRVTLSSDKKIYILSNQNFKCNFCNTDISLENSQFDHVVPYKYVGDELENNIQALCSTCNLEKGTNPFYILKNLLIQPKR